MKTKFYLDCSLILSLVFFLQTCSESTNSEVENIVIGSSIEIYNLSPDSTSIITLNDTIKADLGYVIADTIQSDFGFDIAIIFVSTEGSTFTLVDGNSIIHLVDQDGHLTRIGNVTLVYPLNSLRNISELKHPISCYFHLFKKLSNHSRLTIAKTVRINYNE